MNIEYGTSSYIREYVHRSGYKLLLNCLPGLFCFDAVQRADLLVQADHWQAVIRKLLDPDRRQRPQRVCQRPTLETKGRGRENSQRDGIVAVGFVHPLNQQLLRAVEEDRADDRPELTHRVDLQGKERKT